MKSLSNISRIVADERRRGERSINLPTRDTAQSLLITLEVTEAHSLSAAMKQRTVKVPVAALSAFVDGQDQMATRGHLYVGKVGRQLGLT